MLIVCFLIASNISTHIPGFSGLPKFERDFQSSDKPCVTSLTDMQPMTDERIDWPQSEYDQLQSGCTSDAEESDIGGEKLSRRKQGKMKNDLVSSAATGRER